MNRTFQGILCMTAGTSVLSAMDGGIKWLVERGITSVQIISLRGWIISLTLLLALLLIPRAGGLKALQTTRWRDHLGRSIVGVIAPALFFSSLKYIPLADAVAIFFCTTFVMTAGSVWFLGEQVGIHRWSAVAVGFIGVMVAVQPGTTAFHPASLLVLLASISYASYLISGRWLSRTESSIQLIFYFSFFNTIICSILLLIFWNTFWHQMNNIDVLALFAVSAIALCGYFFITKAITLAQISVIAPIEYIAMFWAVLIGYWFWQETPTPLVWTGIAIILLAGLYIAHRESRLQAETP